MVAEIILLLLVQNVHDTECVKHLMWTGQPREMAVHICHGVPLPPGYWETPRSFPGGPPVPTPSPAPTRPAGKRFT